MFGDTVVLIPDAISKASGVLLSSTKSHSFQEPRQLKSGWSCLESRKLKSKLVHGCSTAGKLDPSSNSTVTATRTLGFLTDRTIRLSAEASN